eukprot:COSAG02_NODE_38776_length_425_cov_0.717791_1_plen_39_part_01
MLGQQWGGGESQNEIRLRHTGQLDLGPNCLDGLGTRDNL